MRTGSARRRLIFHTELHHRNPTPLHSDTVASRRSHNNRNRTRLEYLAIVFTLSPPTQSNAQRLWPHQALNYRYETMRFRMILWAVSWVHLASAHSPVLIPGCACALLCPSSSGACAFSVRPDHPQVLLAKQQQYPLKNRRRCTSPYNQTWVSCANIANTKDVSQTQTQPMHTDSSAFFWGRGMGVRRGDGELLLCKR